MKMTEMTMTITFSREEVEKMIKEVVVDALKRDPSKIKEIRFNTKKVYSGNGWIESSSDIVDNVEVVVLGE